MISPLRKPGSRPRWIGLAIAAMLSGLQAATPAADRPNIVFIAAADLRPDLGAYGNTEVRTPHLDALARRGVRFERAYCQQAVCNPSRASVLTGRRPDTLKVWDLKRHFRETLPEVVTLPQLCKDAGWQSHAFGKLYHLGGNNAEAKQRWMDAGRSWHTAPAPLPPTSRP